MFQTKLVEKIKTHILCLVTFIFPENRTVCEILWKNIVELFFYLLALFCSSFPFYSLSLQSLFCCPPTSFLFSSAGFSPSTVRLVFKTAEFRSSLTLLPASTFLSAISSLICDHLLLRDSTVQLRVSGHFSYRWIRSPPSPIGVPAPLRTAPRYSFQIPSLSRAISLLSCTVATAGCVQLCSAGVFPSSVH